MNQRQSKSNGLKITKNKDRIRFIHNENEMYSLHLGVTIFKNRPIFCIFSIQFFVNIIIFSESTYYIVYIDQFSEKSDIFLVTIE